MVDFDLEESEEGVDVRIPGEDFLGGSGGGKGWYIDSIELDD